MKNLGRLSDNKDLPTRDTATLSTTVRLIVTISQASYDALGTPDANTMYLITS